MKKASPILKKIAQGLGWGVWAGGVLFIVQFALSYLFSWLITTFSINITSALAQTIFSVASYTLGIFIILKVPEKLSQKLKTTKSDLGLNELPTWTDIGLAPVGLIVYALLASVLTTAFSIFPWFNAGETQDVGFNTLLVASDRIFAFFTLVIVAPIAEELIFRGFLYQKIKSLFYKKSSKDTTRKTKRRAEIIAIIVATLITSLTFGIMHGQWNVGVNVFAMSIVLCIMREITGSIYAGILMHMIKNMLAFYLLYIATMSF